ncbi:SH3 domain-containing protein [Apibacter mensalis]|uniref:SH3 domain-containing protein n=1 Tax=Apibacter mensalis TaxID=1586267 RepID=A0A0X3AND5_9FLAO|nr:C40 family peptidase [Apibacter mensalis]CVK15876.1 SH3 domain-containing protein [Apibacter mensalis]
MSKSICQVSVAPVRKEPYDSSEMVTQLLFGELCEIIEVKQQWVKIKIFFDGYEGWVDYKQISFLSETEFTNFSQDNSYISEPFSLLILNNQPFPVTIGAEIHGSIIDNVFELAPNKHFLIEGVLIKGKQKKEQILELAFKYINTPYLWGGKTTYGIDCSGLVQMVYKLAGYRLPRDASQQALEGKVLSFIEEAEPGDLAFFENQEGRIVHVGFILTDQKILHAHGKVRIDNLDYTGIFNSDLNKYTHQLRLIRRIF